MKRHRTLAAFAFTKKVVHRGKEIEVNVSETTADLRISRFILKKQK